MWKESIPGVGFGFGRKADSKKGDLGLLCERCHTSKSGQKPPWKENTALILAWRERIGLYLCPCDCETP